MYEKVRSTIDDTIKDKEETRRAIKLGSADDPTRRKVEAQKSGVRIRQKTARLPEPSSGDAHRKAKAKAKTRVSGGTGRKRGGIKSFTGVSDASAHALS